MKIEIVDPIEDKIFQALILNGLQTRTVDVPKTNLRYVSQTRPCAFEVATRQREEGIREQPGEWSHIGFDHVRDDSGGRKGRDDAYATPSRSFGVVDVPQLRSGLLTESAALRSSRRRPVDVVHVDVFRKDAILYSFTDLKPVPKSMGLLRRIN